MNKLKKILLIIIVVIISTSSELKAQILLTNDSTFIDYRTPIEYEIGGITITGAQNMDSKILILLSGLYVGEKIKVPGDKISKAINNLWKQGLFENISISALSIKGNLIFLNFDLLEKPRLSKFSFNGIKKNEADKVREAINITRGDVITENMLMRTTYRIKKYFQDKGYLNSEVKITQMPDTTIQNTSLLIIDIKKNSKVKVNKINLYGNNNLKTAKLKRTLKKTKEKKFYKLYISSKFINDEFQEDKYKLIDKYNEKGYRDAKITRDTFYVHNKKTVDIDIYVEEGKKYFFRNIKWVGNTKYTSEQLSTVLRIKKGDVYNQKQLDENLQMNANGTDVYSLYMDDGYLFFNATPVEVLIENDSIDLEIRVYEGKQATINKVLLDGNTKTNDNVVMREIRTKPGQLFSRSDVIRSQRELSQLRYFNAEKIGIEPIPNPANSTVDIKYNVEETSTDQVELSGGWGAGMVVGTLGLSFNNFSLKNIFKKEAWQPLPAGDGQKLSLRAQSSGRSYQTYSASFTEPWLGGKKPIAFSVTGYHSVFTNGLSKSDTNRSSTTINGVSLGLAKRLNWPDDFFILSEDLNYQNYILKNSYSNSLFTDGRSNIISLNTTLSRSSVDQPIYPRQGSDISLGLALTPPYSFFNNKDYANLSPQEKYKWAEYYKIKFFASWYTKLAGDLVLHTRSKIGFLGYYNSKIGLAPFERFYLGGDGLSGFDMFDGREIIGLRGYDNNSITPDSPLGSRRYVGGSVYDKFTVEVRYPVSLNPQATIYVMGFLEGGNNWQYHRDFNPFDMKRSAGVGLRVFLPMFGVLGLDWGYGFDKIPGFPGANKSHFHFSINQSID
jgi:outer membrane protein insertion porin family